MQLKEISLMLGTLPYRAGALVGPSIPKPLTTVSDTRQMYVYFAMTENQIRNLIRQYCSPNETIRQMPEIELRLNDGTIYENKGRIETISGAGKFMLFGANCSRHRRTCIPDESYTYGACSG